jgi:magnesium chelatase family protein
VRIEPAIARNDGFLDLAIVAVMLGALGKVPATALEGLVLFGEVDERRRIRPVRGVLPALRGAVAHGISRAIVPRANMAEAAAVAGVDARAAEQLDDVHDHLRGACALPRCVPARDRRPEALDLADVPGSTAAKLALEIAAAGHHSILLLGPPAAGSMMLARRLPALLPTMTAAEACDVTAIHSIAGQLDPEEGLVVNRPCRAPAPSVTEAGLAGRGDPVRPGEVSLAHGGVLLLDDLPRFHRGTLATLDRALAEGRAFVSQGETRTSFPARPLLVVTAYGCPCGFYGDPERTCRCTPERVRSYRQRMRGPVFDRIDMQVELRPVDAESRGKGRSESSEDVRKRVIAARAKQRERSARTGLPEPLNADLREEDLWGTVDVDGWCVLASEGRALTVAVQHKVLRVARTIADIESSEAVRGSHVRDAIQFAPTFWSAARTDRRSDLEAQPGTPRGQMCKESPPCRGYAYTAPHMTRNVRHSLRIRLT